MSKTRMIPVERALALSRGLYARVARKMECDPSYVSRIARGERRSERIDAELRKEFRAVLARLRRFPTVGRL